MSVFILTEDELGIILITDRYSQLPNATFRIDTMDPDGSSQTFLVKYSNGGNGGYGQWSPDSLKVLFVSDEQIHGPLGIINADGTDLRYLYTF